MFSCEFCKISKTTFFTEHLQATATTCKKWIQKQPLEGFYKKAIFKNFAIFTGKHLCWSLFLINFIKKRLQLTQVFSWEYCKNFKNTYYKEHLQIRESIDRYSGKLLFENQDFNIAFRILTGKKHPKIKLQHLQKYKYEHLGHCYIRLTLFIRF